MGTLGGDNGGGRPSDGGGLPDLPPEWGTIVIPDDLTELDDEAAVIRRDFRREARRNRWRKRFGRPPVYQRGDDEPPALGLPLLIMSIAIIATLTSLFAIAWPHATKSAPTPQQPSTAVSTLPDIMLTDAGGTQFRVRDRLPAVILVVDGCPCADLIAATANAVSTPVTVIAVARVLPDLPTGLPAGRDVVAATDPSNSLHSVYPTDAVTALIASTGGGKVIQVTVKNGLADFRDYLTGLS